MMKSLVYIGQLYFIFEHEESDNLETPMVTDKKSKTVFTQMSKKWILVR